MSNFKKMMEALDKPVNGIPTVDQVRARFIDHETEISHSSGWIDGVSDEYGEAFDRWLDRVRAEAWSLGVGVGMFFGSLDIPPNPYRQETGDQDTDLNPSKSMGIDTKEQDA